MITIVIKNSIGAEINRETTDEDGISEALVKLARENIFAPGDVIEIEETN
jgi:hypothetical protein